MKTNNIMKQIRSLIVLLVVMLMPLAANASHQKEGQIDIPEMVLEHLPTHTSGISLRTRERTSAYHCP